MRLKARTEVPHLFPIPGQRTVTVKTPGRGHSSGDSLSDCWSRVGRTFSSYPRLPNFLPHHLSSSFLFQCAWLLGTCQRKSSACLFTLMEAPVVGRSRAERMRVIQLSLLPLWRGSKLTRNRRPFPCFLLQLQIFQAPLLIPVLAQAPIPEAPWSASFHSSLFV